MKEPRNAISIGQVDGYLLLSVDEGGQALPDISAEKATGFQASLRLPALWAETYVWLGPAQVQHPLSVFFSEMEQDWRGWDGGRDWSAYEGGLSFNCTHDGLGHITVSTRLVEARSQAWTIEATLQVDAGHLAALTRQARVLSL